jgi:C-methyltransferase C-terminal domain/Putative zinc binding domain/Methyltransferase domain
VKRITCAGCGRCPLETILDLGSTPLADYFPSSTEEALTYYPLELAVCMSCWMVQLTEVVPDAELFGKDYAFFSGSSPALAKHLRFFAAWAKGRFPEQVARGVTEIACNDGTLLKEFDQTWGPESGFSVHGIDPSGPPVQAAIADNIPVINQPFTSTLAADIGPTNGLVIANNVLAHVTNLNDFADGLSILVGDDGMFVGEFQYLPDLLIGNAFDLVYHEHRSFLSLTSLEPIFWRNGMVIVDAIPQPTQGGSMRIVARRRKPGDSVEIADRVYSHTEGWLRNMRAYTGLQGRVDYIRGKLIDLVAERVNVGKVVAGYAASAKSTTLLNYCEIDYHVLPYVVDTTPHKIGKFTPGTDIPIISPDDEWNSDATFLPSTYLMLASNYLGSAIKSEAKRRGHADTEFIVPLPVPVVI